MNNIFAGIAVGDAIGVPLEFNRNITEAQYCQSRDAKVLTISDDTQMTLFCAEAMSKVGVNVGSAKKCLTKGYTDWFLTQMDDTNCTGKTGLLQFDSLYRRVAPGITCMTSLFELIHGVPVKNDSKGCGTVMRCAPIAAWALKNNIAPELAYKIAKIDAELTHKHPYTGQCSAVLVGIYLNIAADPDFDLYQAVMLAISYVGEVIHVDESISTLLLSVFSEETHRANRKMLGGWVAEEALALAIGAVAHNQDYLTVIKDAVMIDGDSDSVGSIAGGLAVAMGMIVPESYLERLDALDAIAFASSWF